MTSAAVLRAGFVGIAILLLPVVPISLAAAQESFDFQVNGAGDALTKQLRNASLVIEARRTQKTSGQDIYAAARGDYARILGALYAEGYYGAAISIRLNGQEVADIAPLDVPDAVSSLSMVISVGRQFTFEAARMRPYAPGTAIPPGYGDARIARSTAITDAAQAGVDGWRNAGHAKARVADQSVIAEHSSATVRSLIVLDPGPKLRFGHLHLVGYDRVRAERLAEIAGFPAGEVFDPKALDAVVDRTLRTGAFRSAAVTESDSLNADGTLDVTLTVAEEKNRRLGYGAEIASLDGLSVTAFWMHRNFFGGAERLRVDVAVGGIGGQTSGADYSLGARLERPATFNADTTAYAEAKIARLNETDYRENLVTLGFGARRVISNRLAGEAGVAYSASRVSDATGVTMFRSLSLPLLATWDTRNSTLDPTKGYYVQGHAKPFLGFGTTGNGARLYADARVYRAFRESDRVVLAGRLQAGTIVGSSLAATPRDDLFYSGGGGTVRGQPYQSLGVQVLNAGALRTGGMSFLGLSGELRVGATENLGVVGFADVGYVTADSLYGGVSGWHAGAGLGLRYQTGIGPIRFDVALPAGGGTGKGAQVYIGIGQAF